MAQPDNRKHKKKKKTRWVGSQGEEFFLDGVKINLNNQKINESNLVIYRSQKRIMFHLA